MRNIIGFTLVASLCSTVFAQTPNVDQESQSRARRGAAEQKAAEGAAAAKPSAGADVTFEQILAEPGDLDLNERYAGEQIRRGDLRGAATTLERVLILAPDRDNTRLLYAAVLYRLGDAADAERELTTVLSRNVSPQTHQEAAKYLGLVKAGKRHTHFDARLSLGYGYDDNRNAAPDSSQSLFFGQPITLTGNSTRRDDTNVQFAGSLGVNHELGATRHVLFARVGYFRGEQTLVKILDLQAYTAKAGGVFHTRWADFTPTLGFDHVLLSQSSYLRSFNQGLRVSRRVSRRSEVWADFEREDQDFLRTPLITNGADRKGDQYDASLGANYLITPSDRVSATFTHRRKFARADFDAYRRESLGLEYMRLLGRGMFAVAGASEQFDRYDRADATIVANPRHDDGFTGQLLFGAPLNLLWKPLDGFTGTLGYERFQQRSNLTNYQYSNDKLTALLTYSWGI
jgi:hypothetical protein